MRKFLTRALGGLLIFALLFGAFVLIISPQRTAPFKSANGTVLENSISAIRTVNLNGVEQRILIRGKDLDNPLLLHIHGGPGAPDQAIVRSSGKTIEDIFTVVYWDQRGAGGSYDPAMPENELSLSNIVSDGVALSEALTNEYGKDKIYLQGHSWGSLVGINMISAAPHLYHAYFGIGQIADSKRSELLSFNFTVDVAQKAGDGQTLNALRGLGKPPYRDDQTWIDSVMIQRSLMQPYEIPGQPQWLSMADIYTSFAFYREYSVADKLNSLKGSEVSLQRLWMDAINANLFESHPTLPIPVYFFQGLYDKHAVTEVARDYFKAVKAPHKEYFSFESSAHWPHLREHRKYRSLLRQIISTE